MATKHSTALTIISPDKYMIVGDAESVKAYLEEALAPGEQLNIGDLPIIKVPHGATSWELPNGETVKQLDCIIIHRQPTRAYWYEAAGDEGTPPDCTSVDAIHGNGLYDGTHFTAEVEAANPGGRCDTCPMSEWSSKGDGSKAQACRLRTNLYVVLPDAVLPATLVLAPTSHDAAKQYALALGAVHKYVTRLTLVAMGSGPRQYNVVAFTSMGPIPVETLPKVLAYRQGMLTFFRTKPVVTEEQIAAVLESGALDSAIQAQIDSIALAEAEEAEAAAVESEA